MLVSKVAACVVLVVLLLLLVGRVHAQPIFTLFGYDVATDQLITIDLNTAQPTVVGPVGLGFPLVALAYDSVRDTLFGVVHDPSLASQGRLVTVDRSTGQGTAVAAMDFPLAPGSGVSDLAIGPGNALYGLVATQGSRSYLMTVDRATGVGTRVDGSTSGFGELPQSTGLAYQGIMRRMIASRLFAGSSFYDIDPTTGQRGPFFTGFLTGWRSLTTIPGTDDLLAVRGEQFGAGDLLERVEFFGGVISARSSIGRIGAYGTITAIEVVRALTSPPPGSTAVSPYVIEHFEIGYKPNKVFDASTLVIGYGGQVVPVYIARLGEALEEAFLAFQALGFEMPDERVSVTVKNKKGYGAELFGSITIDDDMDREGCARVGPCDGETVYSFLAAIAAHELFHVVQSNYFSLFGAKLGKKFFREGSAVFMETVVIPHSTHYLIEAGEFLNNPKKDLLKRAHDGYVFWRYLAHRFGTDIVRVVWELLRDRCPLEVCSSEGILGDLLQSVAGMTLREVLTDFIAANYLRDRPGVPEIYRYDPGGNVTPTGQKADLKCPCPMRVRINGNVSARGARYHEIQISEGSGVRSVQIDFDGKKKGLLADDDFLPVQVASLKAGEFVGLEQMPLDASNNGSLTLAVLDGQRIAIIVGGDDDGGSYKLTVEAR
ncbi:MAG: hypothetical protein A3A44_03480 [Candidatus Sungbacteria bacterium RIFCSPLOWO2_01_FULL_60_25]|uniref:Uncharacterized protein n=1 Tax=Candidatus Sungbacteria bacterium RIFCSPLOWO2_01_FULL_60_25 TaxID=1802281 RepID=A0A1G2LCJ5_9BACT|nr:MAG: hypothetical protein A3A44_03480 [Candidatus Sungbacteria bacterium RIFCSPLOWO2_01_FULL_60_25]